jgi:hypothetical protein
MTQESLHRIKRYIQMRDEKPIKHSHDIINGVQAGTEWEAELRLSDIRNVIHEIEKLRAALLLARVAVSHACELSDRILYTQDLVRIDAALGEKE